MMGDRRDLAAVVALDSVAATLGRQHELAHELSLCRPGARHLGLDQPIGISD
jgi:hypothetical protein